jgi:hypothetical protein
MIRCTHATNCAIDASRHGIPRTWKGDITDFDWLLMVSIHLWHVGQYAYCWEDGGHDLIRST